MLLLFSNGQHKDGKYPAQEEPRGAFGTGTVSTVIGALFQVGNGLDGVVEVIVNQSQLANLIEVDAPVLKSALEAVDGYVGLLGTLVDVRYLFLGDELSQLLVHFLLLLGHGKVFLVWFFLHEVGSLFLRIFLLRQYSCLLGLFLCFYSCESVYDVVLVLCFADLPEFFSDEYVVLLELLHFWAPVRIKLRQVEVLANIPTRVDPVQSIPVLLAFCERSVVIGLGREEVFSGDQFLLEVSFKGTVSGELGHKVKVLGEMSMQVQENMETIEYYFSTEPLAEYDPLPIKFKEPLKFSIANSAVEASMAFQQEIVEMAKGLLQFGSYQIYPEQSQSPSQDLAVADGFGFGFLKGPLSSVIHFECLVHEIFVHFPVAFQAFFQVLLLSTLSPVLVHLQLIIYGTAGPVDFGTHFQVHLLGFG